MGARRFIYTLLFSFTIGEAAFKLVVQKIIYRWGGRFFTLWHFVVR
jgi:hypothetical protein